MIDAALRAIAEPRRRQILELVQTRELAAGEIASHFDVTRPAISQHLKVLVDSGLVSVRREGTRLLYRPRPEGLEELKEYLARFWDDKLRQLKRAVESDERRANERRNPG